MNEDLIRKVVSGVVSEYLSEDVSMETGFTVPIEASGRHVHLSTEDVEKLFGKGYRLTAKRNLSQPGQFLCEERVSLIGPKATLNNVAVLGPARNHTQVELSMTDLRTIGLSAPVALSGDLQNATDMLIASKKAFLMAKGSLIVAKNHLHLSEEEARVAGLKDGDLVDIRIDTPRPLTFNSVPVRAGETHKLAMHIDFDEANACGWSEDVKGTIVRKFSGNSSSNHFGSSFGNKSFETKPNIQTSVSQNQLDLLPDDVMIGVNYLTEAHVKEALLSGCSAIVVPRKTIVSPLALDCASQNKVEIKRI
ncbi:MAG: phosphate propanoyltransferase [Ruminococcaceae bacterium]|nr:phosphate propanoyltransferase [Oscillospiraceae bacterium]